MKGRIIAGDGIREPYEYAVLCSTCGDSERTCVACQQPEGHCDCEADSVQFRQSLIDNYWGGDPCLELGHERRELAFREEFASRFHPCTACPDY